MIGLAAVIFIRALRRKRHEETRQSLSLLPLANLDEGTTRDEVSFYGPSPDCLVVYDDLETEDR